MSFCASGPTFVGCRDHAPSCKYYMKVHGLMVPNFWEHNFEFFKFNMKIVLMNLWIYCMYL